MIGVVIIALFPAAAFIALGFGLRRTGYLSEGFWQPAEKLCYNFLLPALLFHSLAVADLEALPVWDLGRVLVLTLLIVSALLVAVRPLLRINGPDFTSVFQGGLRFNNYLGVTLAAGLYGGHGLALAALCNAAIVPTVNLLCILVFARYGTARLTGWGVIKQIVTNPLLIACAGGIAVQALGLSLPPGIEPALRSLGATSMPLGLICVGAALTLVGARDWAWPMTVSSVVKFVAMPLVSYPTGRALGVGSEAMMVALLFMSLPTASAAYILSRQLGGNAQLMAGIVAVQTLLSAITIPLVFAIVG